MYLSNHLLDATAATTQSTQFNCNEFV